MKGKRFKKIKVNRVLSNAILVMIFLLTTFLVIEMYKENEIQNKNENQINKKQEVTKIATKEKVFLQNVEKEYKGYLVIAMLQIPKIDVNTCVLAEYSKDSLYECVTKFYGKKPNEVGNFCIAGHNSKRKNMFTHIKELEIGDEIILTDNEYGSIIYKVYEKYKVLPEDTSCLSQNTNKREITLITCTNDSSKRIIVKAVAEE